MGFKHGKNLKLKDKKTILIESSVVIGNNVTIYENNHIGGNTTIGDNCVILPGNFILDCIVGQNNSIHASIMEKSVVKDNCQIGPYSRLRPNANVGNNCRVGNFVELKNATLGDGTKASHLAYVGDATIGKNCNIGCGSIFVNFNGKIKQHSSVGDNCFVGSNCNIIAPINIANNSYICAGTTITKDTNEHDFVIGRVREEIKPERAKKYMKEEK